MKKAVLFVLTILQTLNVFSFSKPEERPEFTMETYPVVDGSTATIDMSYEFAMTLLGISREEAENYIVHNTTYGAYETLLSGKSDIILVSDPPPQVYEKAEELGFELEVTPFGRDAFVFITNIENPVENLSLEQIQGIYTGQITSWKEVGGDDEEIIAYQRNEDSGSQTIMRQVVMAGLEMMPAPGERISDGMGMIIDEIAEYDNSKYALGYSIYYFETYMHPNPEIKLVGVNGIIPNDETIRDGTYLFGGNAVAIIRSTEPEDSPARQLLKWIMSAEGQDAVERGGFVRIE